jgi:hypothetical protein
MRATMNMMTRIGSIIAIVGMTATTALADPKPSVMNPVREPAMEKSSLIVTTDYFIVRIFPK